MHPWPVRKWGRTSAPGIQDPPRTPGVPHAVFVGLSRALSGGRHAFSSPSPVRCPSPDLGPALPGLMPRGAPGPHDFAGRDSAVVCASAGSVMTPLYKAATLLTNSAPRGASSASCGRARNPYSRWWWLWIPGPRLGRLSPTKARPGMTKERVRDPRGCVLVERCVSPLTRNALRAFRPLSAKRGEVRKRAATPPLRAAAGAA
ncbi:hypothetical protein V1282_006079 [Nitrobacteraceae bacterium AZCC 2146]